MDGFLQFFWAMVDAGQAAMIGLNAIPVIVLAILVGLAQMGRGAYSLKAILAVVPAIVIAALWPKVYGMSPIWPDVTQIEAEIQIGVQFILAWMIIRVLWSVKSTALNATRRIAKEA